jgi:hypothetical protein
MPAKKNTSWEKPAVEVTPQVRAIAKINLARVRKGKRQSVMSRYEWAHEKLRIDGKPFSLDSYPCLQDVYRDERPNIVLMKAAQRGLSQFALADTLWTLDVGAEYYETGKIGLNVGYLFPTQQALIDFSKERISGLVRESPYLQTIFADGYDDVTFKQCRESYLYLRGAFSAAAIKSFPADKLVLDEYDEMDPAQVALARRRLNASMLAHEVNLSTPTLPEHGIHLAYQESDRQTFETWCDSHKGYVGLDFFETVRANLAPYSEWKEWERGRIEQADFQISCPVCAQSVDRMARGQWVAKNPEALVRGYHIPWWPFKHIKLRDLALKATSRVPHEREEFFRSDLGIPYEVVGSRITPDMVMALAAYAPARTSWRSTTMGVDVGERLHFRISSLADDSRRYVRRMGFVKSWAELAELMDFYNVRMCVIDANPDTISSRAFSDKFPSRVHLAYYPDSKAMGVDLYQLPSQSQPEDHWARRAHEDESGRRRDTVKINRTYAMDLVYETVAAKREGWPLEVTSDPDVRKQMCAPQRIVELVGNNDRAAWTHPSEDHYFHCCVYDIIAARLPYTRMAGVSSLALGSTKGWNPAGIVPKRRGGRIR